MFANRKNVRRFLIIPLYAILLTGVGYVSMTIGGVLLYNLFRIKSQNILILAFITLLLFIFFHVHKIYKTRKNSDICKKNIIIELSKRGAFILVVVSLVYFGMIHQFNSQMTFFKCEIAPKEFQGKVYSIETCIEYDRLNDHSMRLRVFDEKEELLVARYYIYHQIGENDVPYEFFENGLFYFNTEGNRENLLIPPSKWDWFLARIPFSRIGQFEMLWYNPR
ncbi:MAG: hypothetical protein FWD51_00710 [Betaproteobacteria bacterium]|nr:hypothetical protein [Betaproteobacteria bacterium]